MSQFESPKVSLEQTAAAARQIAGEWQVSFRVVNLGAERLEIDAVRLPHGQFKSEQIRFARPLLLDAQANANFEAQVHCQEPPGLVTENAFVILYVKYQGEGWRVFGRIRVVMSEGGVPSSTVESITTQQVGFSGVTS